MFERFTERSRQIVVLAQQEAGHLGHNYVDTEHLLLGMIHEEQGIAARVLAAYDVSLEDCRAWIVKDHGADTTATEESEHVSGAFPFTREVKRILEYALREALSLGHNYIGTEHLLLALSRESETVAMRFLLDRDIDSRKIRRSVTNLLGNRPIDAGDYQSEGTVPVSAKSLKIGELSSSELMWLVIAATRELARRANLATNE